MRLKARITPARIEMGNNHGFTQAFGVVNLSQARKVGVDYGQLRYVDVIQLASRFKNSEGNYSAIAL